MNTTKRPKPININAVDWNKLYYTVVSYTEKELNQNPVELTSDNDSDITELIIETIYTPAIWDYIKERQL